MAQRITARRACRESRGKVVIIVKVGLGNWKRWAGRLKLESYALYLAYQDPRVPRYVKVLAAVVIGLAFSPIDLIPDFIPVLGYLDDIIVVPLGVALVVRLMPEDVLAESRQRAGEMIERGEKPLSRGAAAVVVGLWLIFAAAVIFVVARVVLA